MNNHVSGCKYYCLHLVPKFGDMCDRQNWRLHPTVHVVKLMQLMEPTTVGSLWLENDLNENELEFESYMGRSKKNVRVTSDGIHAEIHEIWTCVAPAAPPLCHAAVNPCLQSEFSWRESPWNWSSNSVNLRKSTVTWMSRHYVFTVISRWSTFSSTVNLCNINCVIFSDTHCSLGPPIISDNVAQSISCGGVVLLKSWRLGVRICRYRRLYLCLPFNNLSKLVHKSSS